MAQLVLKIPRMQSNQVQAGLALGALLLLPSAAAQLPRPRWRRRPLAAAHLPRLCPCWRCRRCFLAAAAPWLLQRSRLALERGHHQAKVGSTPCRLGRRLGRRAVLRCRRRHCRRRPAGRAFLTTGLLRLLLGTAAPQLGRPLHNGLQGGEAEEARGTGRGARQHAPACGAAPLAQGEGVR